ncbi:MAG: translational GTPase TypA [Christensenellaceae bacterium]|jgi:GTP-binding protein|nr:translational GTPase TypA [Christensenellaceae bacterium]
MIRNDLRNIAIIAHVDHGKTTLVDALLAQGGVFRANQAVEDCVMDSNPLERERGITILAKNTSCIYKDIKINIVDTPGHADFSGEVERVLKMINGVVLLVDAYEGPMPQTRFVLQKALEMNHKVIICINKIDKADARPREVLEEVYDLLLELNANDEQLESPVVYCSGRGGTASLSPDDIGTDISPLFETIVSHIAPPEGDENAPLQVLVSSIDYNDFVGRIAIGRIERGIMHPNREVTVCEYHEGVQYKSKITNIYIFDGLKKVAVESASVGDVVSFSGISGITIGQTVCANDLIEPLPFVKIGEPTLQMEFSVNNSPFAGREGKYVTSRHLRSRLEKELLKDVSLKVVDGDTADSFLVSGRGEIHLSILIENMRREGYEFQVGMPRVINKTIDGVICEPAELLVCEVPNEFVSKVMEQMGIRQGELVKMSPSGDTRMKCEFRVPERGLIGYKNEFLNNTHGQGIMSALFDGYMPMKKAITTRITGSLIAHETGEAVTYGMYNAQGRGVLFIVPGEQVYEGMVVGMTPSGEEITVNICKTKHVTNMRASGSDDALRLETPRRFSLEECIEFLAADELLEVTPKNLRIRKITLDKELRMRILMKQRDALKK